MSAERLSARDHVGRPGALPDIGVVRQGRGRGPVCGIDPDNPITHSNTATSNRMTPSFGTVAGPPAVYTIRGVFTRHSALHRQ